MIPQGAPRAGYTTSPASTPRARARAHGTRSCLPPSPDIAAAVLVHNCPRRRFGQWPAGATDGVRFCANASLPSSEAACRMLHATGIAQSAVDPATLHVCQQSASRPRGRAIPAPSFPRQHVRVPTCAIDAFGSWSSWYGFTNNINESMLRGMADGMAGSGLLAAGYQHIWARRHKPRLPGSRHAARTSVTPS